MWNWLLVKLGFRTDWTDPRNTPPAFPDVQPHKYAPHATLDCCELCGGGVGAKIHKGAA